ncbi:IS1634 family transposase [Desulfotruncus alcoholivorax]|uniref:IS1634 family transposase n=1 Tax=Desulfotruncus alcoholivorax TaxID=265477 RepID=UPI0003F82DE6|nr:transposase [Desulfotruncus alcoholivorax]
MNNKNPEEAKKQQLTWQAIIEKLEQTLKTAGPKVLLGNRGYRRYLKMDKKAVTINEEAVKEDAKYDGKYILRTNCDLPPDEIALGYKGLWQVDRAFRSLKSTLDLRHIYHWKEERVRNQIFVCFLAFVLQVMLAQKKTFECYVVSYTIGFENIFYTKYSTFAPGKYLSSSRRNSSSISRSVSLG